MPGGNGPLFVAPYNERWILLFLNCFKSLKAAIDKFKADEERCQEKYVEAMNGLAKVEALGRMVHWLMADKRSGNRLVPPCNLTALTDLENKINDVISVTRREIKDVDDPTAIYRKLASMYENSRQDAATEIRDLLQHEDFVFGIKRFCEQPELWWNWINIICGMLQDAIICLLKSQHFEDAVQHVHAVFNNVDPVTESALLNMVNDLGLAADVSPPSDYNQESVFGLLVRLTGPSLGIVGNLSGPSNLCVAVAQVYAYFWIPKLNSALSLRSRGGILVKVVLAALKTSNRPFEGIEFLTALKAKDIAKLKSWSNNVMSGSYWHTGMLGLNLLALYPLLREGQIIDTSSVASVMGSSCNLVGIANSLSALIKLESMFPRVAQSLGAIGSVLAILYFTFSFFEARERQDVFNETWDAIGAIGGAIGFAGWMCYVCYAASPWGPIGMAIGATAGTLAAVVPIITDLLKSTTHKVFDAWCLEISATDFPLMRVSSIKEKVDVLITVDSSVLVDWNSYESTWDSDVQSLVRDLAMPRAIVHQLVIKRGAVFQPDS